MQLINKILVCFAIIFSGFTCVNIAFNPAIEEIKLNHSEYEMFIESSVDLWVISLPVQVSEYKVNWSASSPEYASVENGQVYAKKIGQVTVTARVGELSASCVITIKEHLVSNVEINYPSSVLLVGEQHSPTIEIAPVNATNKNLIFTSSNNDIIAVDQHGNIEAKSLGSATVTATASSGAQATFTFNIVDQILATNVYINITNTTIRRHKTIQLLCSFAPYNATNTDITWTSANESIATVSSNGTVKGIKSGTTTICGKTSNNLQIFCTVSVTEVHTTLITIENSIKLIGVDVGYKTILVCSLLPTNTTDLVSEILFESLDTSVAIVDSNGNFKAVGSGTTMIKLTLGETVSFYNVLVY